MRASVKFIFFLAISLTIFGGAITAQTGRGAILQEGCGAQSPITGVYRIDVDRSDRLYSVLEAATGNVPYGDQSQFFMDLAVRLTPPDLLAIECRGRNVSLASSRASKVNFLADGVTRSAKNADGQTVRSRIAFERSSLHFTSTGGDENLSFTFTPIEAGSGLRVTRRISARELTQPIIIQTVYNKIGAVARWDLFEDSTVARNEASERNERPTNAPQTLPRRTTRAETGEAETLRRALDEWIAATNRRDINRQMSFYMPQMKAFYLTRNVPRSSVRAEKNRVFAAARTIDIRAAEPEIIFQDGGRTAVMRFRKKYNVSNKSGEVVQELRWQRTANGWKIFSERDIRVIR
jgi:ketosteroid isomerase-like protein